MVGWLGGRVLGGWHVTGMCWHVTSLYRDRGGKVTGCVVRACAHAVCVCDVCVVVCDMCF